LSIRKSAEVSPCFARRRVGGVARPACRPAGYYRRGAVRPVAGKNAE